MWNLPPYPPKDYALREVANLQRDSPQFAPVELPRVSQKNLGVYCYPIEYAQGEVPEKIELEAVNPYLMNKWTDDLRAYWVDPPGKNDEFIHKMHRKYSVNVNDDYDARFKHGEKVFNRSYNYELDCLKERRLDSVRKKCERDFEEYENVFRTIEVQEKAQEPPPFPIEPCEHSSPFWWEGKKKIDDAEQKLAPTLSAENKTKYNGRFHTKEMSLRWADEPNLTAAVMDDPCLRRRNMFIVGQPFKSEACNWYYENYPPPKVKFTPKRFA